MKLFSNLSKTSTNMMIAIGILCLITLGLGLSIIFFVYRFEKPIPFIVGMVTGCIHSMIKVILLEKSIRRSIDMEKKQAESYAHLQFLARYAITIVIFVMVIKFPNIFGLFGTILGVLSLQIAAHITSIVLKKSKYEDV